MSGGLATPRFDGAAQKASAVSLAATLAFCEVSITLTFATPCMCAVSVTVVDSDEVSKAYFVFDSTETLCLNL